MLDDLDFEETPEDGDLPPEESSNRTFLMVAAGLGVVIVLGIICIAGYAILNRPATDGTSPEALTAEAQNAQTSLILTQTAIAAAFSPTPSNTAPPTATQPPPSATSAVVGATNTPDGLGDGDGPTPDPRTATVQALLTQASVAQTQAANQVVTTTPTSTPVGTLPDTGLLEDAGLPALAGLTALLLVVIFAARRLRSVNG